jgi:Mn2+/Fe2+ NRAMP family transporter
VKGFLRVALGVITSLGGFLEVGSVSTSAQAGASFGFALLWASVLAAIALACLLEMTGRLAAVSGHTFAAAVRGHFGVPMHLVLVATEVVLDSLLLAAEVGGVSIALELGTGVAARWWAVPVGLAVWVLLWRGTFGVIENGVAALGLVTLAFVVAVFVLGPRARDVAAGLVPRLPERHLAVWGFQAVAILGATVSPYLLNFYSSGAIEDGWKESQIRGNRIIAAVGTAFGATVSMAILVVAGTVLAPRGIQVERYDQAALMLTQPFPRWGFVLFTVSLAIGCFGAALEVALNLGYLIAQTLGWNWGENEVPRRNARFCCTYTLFLVPATLVILLGVDPLRLTLVTMAVTVIALPLVVFPLLFIMNDDHYLGPHTNGRLANLIVATIVVAGAVMALLTLPLEIAGGG